MKVGAFGVAAVVGIASSVFGQFQTQGVVTYTLSSQIWGQGAGAPWSAPVPGGNGDAHVDIGEGVLFKITVGMSVEPGHASTQFGALGGALTWDPSIQHNSSGTGTNAGFWGSDLNLVGDAGAASAAGTWSDGSSAWALAVRRRLIVATAGNGIGFVNGNGSGLTDIFPAQFVADAEQLSHANNFVTFQALWIPSDYLTLRSVTFAISTGSLGNSTWVAAADSNYDTGYTQPVALTSAVSYVGAQTYQLGDIPAPAGMGVLVLAGLGASRRRR